jgi:hypothetical protein
MGVMGSMMTRGILSLSTSCPDRIKNPLGYRLENKNAYTDHYADPVEVRGLWVRVNENYFNSAE